jgi:hypothetical protein
VGMWAVRRRDFRWYVEGVILLVTWLIILGISVPGLYTAKERRAQVALGVGMSPQ